MIEEEKSFGMIIQTQTTYYVYLNEEEKKKGNHIMCASHKEDAVKFTYTIVIDNLLKK